MQSDGDAADTAKSSFCCQPVMQYVVYVQLRKAVVDLKAFWAVVGTQPVVGTGMVRAKTLLMVVGVAVLLVDVPVQDEGAAWEGVCDFSAWIVLLLLRSDTTFPTTPPMLPPMAAKTRPRRKKINMRFFERFRCAGCCGAVL